MCVSNGNLQSNLFMNLIKLQKNTNSIRRITNSFNQQKI